jgi:hypothetical protein
MGVHIANHGNNINRLQPTAKLDELKAQLNRYFIQIGENQKTSHVIVHVPCVDFGEDMEEDFWNRVLSTTCQR